MGDSCLPAAAECEFAGGGGVNCGALKALSYMETSATILLVEDHIVTHTFLSDNLAADGFTLLHAGTVDEAREQLEHGYPDLALIDLGLPDGDGLELVRLVRAADPAWATIDPDLPMIVLTGRGGDLDRLRGFRNGADDYVAKPFNYQELLARIQALLRRTRSRPPIGRLRAGSLEVDPALRTVRLHGEEVHVSAKEFALLRVLASDPGRTFTREELLRAVWGFQTPVPTRTVDSHAHRLRHKLSVAGDRFVVNVWGVGYRLIEGGEW
jgi:DNA-binding response OmpR family regulator